ncbi:MAG: lytic transglycosylase domain-containing protein, partial [Pseudomonadota bacterium]|nr:lytic transglycosylase domain-containing protein [Pseudomonadota bacterium]
MSQAALVPVAAIAQQAPLPASASAVASDIARWNSLRQSDSLPFSAYASFLATHRGWPGETAMRRTAERRIDPSSVSAAEVVRYFSVHPPLTAAGHARHALALLAMGEVERARAVARQAWLEGAMPQADESRLLGAFGAALSQSDHDARVEVLLDHGDISGAQRVLPMASVARRPLFEARIALKTRAADAPSRVAALGPIAFEDAGLLMDRALYLRNTGQSQASRELLARPRRLAAPPRSPHKWLETQVLIARAAAADRQWSLAYQIASQIEDAYPAGTDVSQKSFGERDEYTNLAWLGGTAALRHLGRPADAARLFELYGRAAQSPQTRTKGIYWAGRAMQQAGQQDRARANFAEAGRHYDQFYGQLALE